MARENADRENAEIEIAARFDLMLSEMRRQAEEFGARLERGAAVRPSAVCKSAGMSACHGTGHAGAI